MAAGWRHTVLLRSDGGADVYGADLAGECSVRAISQAACRTSFGAMQ